MSARFEVLDWRPTPMGDISLRRRHDPVVDADVFEVKLGEEFLMSSLFTVAEIEVARMALGALPATGSGSAPALDVVVGGLGLGYTAQTVLDDPRVRSLLVVEALEAVIDWHEKGLVPVSVSSASDSRCRLVEGDFFALAAADGFDPDRPDRRFHAIVVDIDHSPRHLLHPRHAWFYEAEGAQRMAERLHPGGVFSLWSNDPPDDAYLAVLEGAFATASCQVVSFHNPLQDRDSTNSVYVATTSSD